MGQRTFKKSVSDNPFKSISLSLVFFLLPLDQLRRKEEERDLRECEASLVVHAIAHTVSLVKSITPT